MRLRNCITDVPGVAVGHAHSASEHTGCTVVLTRRGAIAGVDIGGSAPGTRETELLNPTNRIMRIHAVLLAGGSTFGLAAASGVQEYLQDHDIGFHAAAGVTVPIVPSAVVFDLDVGNPRRYPDRTMGLAACRAASRKRSREGPVGAGIGCTCGKILGSECAMRGGLGTGSERLPGGIVVGALAVCNAWGDVIDPKSGRIIAGARRSPSSRTLLHTERYVARQRDLKTRYFGMDTTLCVVATNARLDREETTKVAMMAQDGIARVVRPSHTLFDGDVVFALSTLEEDAPHTDVNIVGSVAAGLVARSISRAVALANGIACDRDGSMLLPGRRPTRDPRRPPGRRPGRPPKRVDAS